MMIIDELLIDFMMVREGQRLQKLLFLFFLLLNAKCINVDV